MTLMRITEITDLFDIKPHLSCTLDLAWPRRHPSSLLGCVLWFSRRNRSGYFPYHNWLTLGLSFHVKIIPHPRDCLQSTLSIRLFGHMNTTCSSDWPVSLSIKTVFPLSLLTRSPISRPTFLSTQSNDLISTDGFFWSDCPTNAIYVVIVFWSTCR